MNTNCNCYELCMQRRINERTNQEKKKFIDAPKRKIVASMKWKRVAEVEEEVASKRDRKYLWSKRSFRRHFSLFHCVDSCRYTEECRKGVRTLINENIRRSYYYYCIVSLTFILVSNASSLMRQEKGKGEIQRQQPFSSSRKNKKKKKKKLSTDAWFAISKTTWSTRALFELRIRIRVENVANRKRQTENRNVATKMKLPARERKKHNKIIVSCKRRVVQRVIAVTFTDFFTVFSIVEFTFVYCWAVTNTHTRAMPNTSECEQLTRRRERQNDVNEKWKYKNNK